MDTMRRHTGHTAATGVRPPPIAAASPGVCRIASEIQTDPAEYFVPSHNPAPAERFFHRDLRWPDRHPRPTISSSAAHSSDPRPACLEMPHRMVPGKRPCTAVRESTAGRDLRYRSRFDKDKLESLLERCRAWHADGTPGRACE